MQWHVLSLFDPGNDLQGRKIGVRVAADLWAEPTESTMLAMSATVSTVGTSYAARVAAGWRMLNRVYIGPEAIVYGAWNYRQVRLGLHLTGLKTSLFDWRLEWQGGLGYAIDDDGRDGPYGRIGVLWRR
jgi:hypothetical protein